MTTMAENKANGEARTTIDSLVDLLKSKGKLDLNSTALSLGVAPNIVETWAKVLESGGIVKISYEMGKMYIEILQMGKEELGAAERKLENEKSAAEAELESQKITLDRFSEAINNVNVNIEALEKQYKSALPDIENLLTQINRFEEASSSSTKKTEDMAKKAEDTYDAINKRFEELSKRLDTLGYTTFDRAIEDSNAKVAAALKSANEAREAIRLIESSNNEAFKAILKNIGIQAEELRKQALQKNEAIIGQLKDSSATLEAAIKSLQEHSNEVRAANSDLSDFKMHRNKALRDLNLEKSEFNDVYAKMHTFIMDNQNKISSAAKALSDKVNTLKSSFGDAAALYDKLTELKKEAGDLAKQVEGTKAEISDLSNQLKALDTLTKMPLVEKVKKVNDTIDKSKKMKRKVSGIKKDIDNLSKKL